MRVNYYKVWLAQPYTDWVRPCVDSHWVSGYVYNQFWSMIFRVSWLALWYVLLCISYLPVHPSTNRTCVCVCIYICVCVKLTRLYSSFCHLGMFFPVSSLCFGLFCCARTHTRTHSRTHTHSLPLSLSLCACMFCQWVRRYWLRAYDIVITPSGRFTRGLNPE